LIHDSGRQWRFRSNNRKIRVNRLGGSQVVGRRDARGVVCYAWITWSGEERRAGVLREFPYQRMLPAAPANNKYFQSFSSNLIE
jgi:hypothetical protein